jgi:cellulose biosynthesis protein BcsQ
MLISISNIKGGVGKTTTAVNLAAAFSLKGLRVLLYDMDMQKACRFFFETKKISKNLFSTEYNNLFIYENQKIDKSLLNDYDIVIFDTPAGLNKKIKTAINLSDITIVPTIPSLLAIRTYNDLIDKGYKNIRLLLNGVEKKEEHKKIVSLILNLPKDQYFKTYIPKSKELENLPFYQKNIFRLNPTSLASKAYKKLLNELV